IRLRAGRDFSSIDRPGAPRAAIVSENLSARLWPGESPIGKRLLDSFGRGKDNHPSQWRTVVGIVSAARYRELDRTRYDLYVPVGQAAEFEPENVVVRAAGDPRRLRPAVAALLSKIDPQLTAADVTTMDEALREVRAPWRFNMLLFSVFACMSIVLTIIGIAALVVSTVNGRRREIGVRIAMGARAHQIVSLFALQGARSIGIGVCLGVVASLLASHLLADLLFDVAASDRRTLMTVAAGVFALGVLATYLAARRASALDPASVFREA
ncbi:MAG TPA: FtsX-like permease family protein, partial [Vicinamibacterales bacterium]